MLEPAGIRQVDAWPRPGCVALFGSPQAGQEDIDSGRNESAGLQTDMFCLLRLDSLGPWAINDAFGGAWTEWHCPARILRWDVHPVPRSSGKRTEG